jgi:hypothetical protein
LPERNLNNYCHCEVFRRNVAEALLAVLVDISLTDKRTAGIINVNPIVR